LEDFKSFANYFLFFWFQARSDCPGWRRRPIDTFRDLGDLGGLYTHCVDVRLENGTVLYQNTQSMHPICVDSFLQMWRQTLIQVMTCIIHLRIQKEDVWLYCKLSNNKQAFNFIHFRLQEYKTPVSVLCCDYDRCNGPNAGAPETRQLSSVIFFASTFTLAIMAAMSP